jgi:hypothetical protein
MAAPPASYISSSCAIWLRRSDLPRASLAISAMDLPLYSGFGW